MTDMLTQRVVAAIGHQYQVEDEIGRGGMAVVYRAHDLRLHRSVAIKVLPPELAYDPAIRMRFTREAQTAAQLSHPHIVPIYDVGDREGIAYFVMAIITENLGSRLANDPHQSIEEVRRLMIEIADALAYAHTRGVIHRDIKPDNILLDGDRGRAVVTDFGIARAMESGTRLTVTGNAVGTPTYMSPEQAMGDREVDGRSDIYSLGVLGYQLLTGRVPFSAGNSMALLLKHVGETARPIAELRGEAPRPLREAIERALMKAPDDRWPTAAALRDALASNRGSAASWREPDRGAASPPDQVRVEREHGSRRNIRAPVVAGRVDLPAIPRAVVAPGALELEPAHFASLTPEQRMDIRLWHGRVHLYDRIKAMRGYALLTLATTFGGFGAMAAGVDGGFPPALLALIVPAYMWRKLWRRGKSLRAAGLRLRRVLMMPRAKWVLPQAHPTAAAVPAKVTEQQLAKLAPREILESPGGAAIRRAAEDRAAILAVVASLPKEDRKLLPDVEPTTNGLVERVAELAQMLHRLEDSVDQGTVDELESRIAELEHEANTPEGERRLSLLKRQRSSLDDLSQRRSVLSRQLDNAVLALGNLRLDLIKLRSSGLHSALSDVSTATQEARALSREISALLHAAAEVRGIG